MSHGQPVLIRLTYSSKTYRVATTLKSSDGVANRGASVCRSRGEERMEIGAGQILQELALAGSSRVDFIDAYKDGSVCRCQSRRRAKFPAFQHQITVTHLLVDKLEGVRDGLICKRVMHS